MDVLLFTSPALLPDGAVLRLYLYEEHACICLHACLITVAMLPA